jgi:hypothetical protein
MPDLSPYLWIGSIALLLVVIGFSFLAGVRRRRDASARPRLRPVRGMFGMLLLAVGILAGLLAFTVYRYLQLFDDTPVAMIVLKQEGPQRFQATVTLNNHGVAGAAPTVQEFTLTGDAWLVDARVLRWQLPAAMAGVPSLYRLERLSGRYDDIDKERTEPRSVFALTKDAGPDLWTLKRQFGRWLPFVDAQYGNATWMPMFDNARYLVLFNDRGGLLAKPADEATAEALRTRGW